MKISSRLALMATFLSPEDSVQPASDDYTFLCHCAVRARSSSKKEFLDSWMRMQEQGIPEYTLWPEVKFLEDMGMGFSSSEFSWHEYYEGRAFLPEEYRQTARFLMLQFAILLAKEQGL